MDIIEERDGSNNLIAFYTRTGNIGEVLSRTTSTDTFYYHYDGNGNVVLLTDASENVVATYEYDAYGNLQAFSGVEANNNPFRYSTKYFDNVAGFYDYGFRFYDSVTGRWLSRDPIGENGGLNLYGFVGNGPVNAWDEYGLQEQTSVTNRRGYWELWRMAREEAMASRIPVWQTEAWSTGLSMGRNLHHVFAKMYKGRFDRILGKGEIDRYLLEVPKWANQYFHRACKGGRGGWWNTAWRNFFRKYDNLKRDPTKEEVWAYARKLMRHEGLEGMKFVSKNAPKHIKK